MDVELTIIVVLVEAAVCVVEATGASLLCFVVVVINGVLLMV